MTLTNPGNLPMPSSATTTNRWDLAIAESKPGPIDPRPVNPDPSHPPFHSPAPEHHQGDPPGEPAPPRSVGPPRGPPAPAGAQAGAAHDDINVDLESHPPPRWPADKIPEVFSGHHQFADTPSHLVLHEGDSGQLRGNAAAVKDLSAQPSMLASAPRAHAAPMISIGKISTNPIYYVSQVAPGPEAYYSGSGEKPGT